MMPTQPERPTICLNMIVKNEAQIIGESLASVAPYIDYWVIIDTGSNDGTQDVVRATMAELGIPGELHERPWRDFGHNRTEALKLAQGRCEYIWVNDADDVLEGTPDFRGLTADGYFMLLSGREVDFWQLHLFRDGVAWRYVGATHEYAICSDPHTEEQLPGNYRILYRETGSNSLGSQKLSRDRELLLAEIERNPENSRPVFYLAATYRAMADYPNARAWFAQRAEMGGFEEEVYYSLLKLAEAMDKMGDPWPDVQAAYLSAWAFRPIRAEALYEIAFHYRSTEQYELGYLFASRGAQIPVPDSDVLFVQSEIHNWRLLDEQAVCASWVGRKAEALRIDRLLLTREDLPDVDRQRILENRDQGAAELLAACAAYPAGLAMRAPSRSDAEVTVSLAATANTSAVQQTLNSFMRCCTDIERVGRFLIVDAGMTPADREVFAGRYPFVDFVAAPEADLNVVRQQIGGRYWLHLWHGWQFFTEEALITRLTDVLESEPEVYQVGVNFSDALQLTIDSPARSGVQVTPRGNRYVLNDEPTTGPAMFDMTRLNRVLEKTTDGALRGPTATLDEVLCIHTP